MSIIRSITLASGETFNLVDWGNNIDVTNERFGLDDKTQQQDRPQVALTLEGRVNQIIQQLEQLTTMEYCSKHPLAERMEQYDELSTHAKTYHKLLGVGDQAIRLFEAEAEAKRSTLNEITGKVVVPYKIRSEPEFGLSVRFVGPRQRPTTDPYTGIIKPPTDHDSLVYKPRRVVSTPTRLQPLITEYQDGPTVIAPNSLGRKPTNFTMQAARPEFGVRKR